MIIRQAGAVQVSNCGECGMVHIMLLDADDMPFAEAVIPHSSLPGLVEDMKKAAYRAAVEKDR